MVNEFQVDIALRGLGSRLLGARGAEVLGARQRLLHYVYVDNIGSLGTSRDLVRDSIRAVSEHLNGLGLQYHEPTDACEKLPTLGVEFDAKAKGFLPTSKRYWSIRTAIGFILRKGRCSGRVLERLVGHCTYFSLLRRAVMSTLCTVYKFIRQSYERRVKLWDTVAAELRCPSFARVGKESVTAGSLATTPAPRGEACVVESGRRLWSRRWAESQSRRGSGRSSAGRTPVEERSSASTPSATPFPSARSPRTSAGTEKLGR